MQRPNKAPPFDAYDNVQLTTILKLSTSERINQYVYCRRVPRDIGNSHVDVSVCRDMNSTGNGEVLVKAVKRRMPEDKYRQLRRNHRIGNRLLSGEQSIQKEVAVLRSCRHANVVQLLEVIDDPGHDRVYLVMEYMKGGQVQWRNQHNEPILTVSQSRRVFRDVILGLEYLHHLGIIHRDIKPANLVWSEDRSIVKIIDYGICHVSVPHGVDASLRNSLWNSALFSSDDIGKQHGTGYFMAPEVAWIPPASNSSPRTSLETCGSSLTMQPSITQIPSKRPPITKAIDVWSLAVTLYCFLFGQLPFHVFPDANNNHHHNRYMLFKQICTQDWIVPESMGADGVLTGGRLAKDHDDVVFLLERMLQKDPMTRFSLDEVKHHPWVLQDIPKPEAWVRATAPVTPGSESHRIKRFTEQAMDFLCRKFSCC